MNFLDQFKLKSYPLDDTSEYWVVNDKTAPETSSTLLALSNAITSACVVFSCDQRELYIMSIKTEEPYLGNKYGMQLIKKIAEIYQDRVDFITLDDMSDGVPPRNCYYKLGFQVQNCYGRWVKWYLSSKASCERKIPIKKLLAYKF